MPLLAVLILMATCLTSAPIAQLKSTERILLRVEVTDEMGAVIPNTRVFIRWDPSGSKVGVDSNVGIAEDLTLKTDDMGIAATLLPPGFYDVFISSMAFTPQAQKVRLKQKARSMRFEMKLDPIVTKEMPSVTVFQGTKP